MKITKGGADVKIMDRFFRHREVPNSENFSKPGFQLKKASFLGVFVGRTGPKPAGEKKTGGIDCEPSGFHKLYRATNKPSQGEFLKFTSDGL